MKTRQTIAAMLLAAVGIWSCQQEAFQEEEMQKKDVKEGVVNEPAPLKQMSVTALWQSDETRTSVYHDNDAGRYSFLWEPGDAISLVETDGNMALTAQSNTLSEQCSTARFSMALANRGAGGHLYYTAYYPVSAMPEGKSASWANGAISLPLVLHATQQPGANSFDGAADLLVSLQTEQEVRPEELELQFKRIGTVLKLVVTGLPAETSLLGGTLNLGYDSVGEILYNADTHKATSVALQKSISFKYDQPLAVQGGSATIWLRVFSGVANRQISLVLNAKEDEEQVTYTRNINLMVRNASIHFKEGGLTTFSVNVSGTVPGDGIIPRDLLSVPTLKINTRNGAAIKNKTTWIPSTVSLVCDNKETLIEADDINGDVVQQDGTVKYNSPTIRGRGNTTWSFPKKPYYLKFNKKQNLFGTPKKSKKYILLANWMDRTNLRNAVAFEAARRTSMEWAPKGMFVNLVLNGDNKGLYYLVEKIEVEEGRLDNTKVQYLFTLDVSDLSEAHFYINYGYSPNGYRRGNMTIYNELPVEVKYPESDDVSAQQWQSVLSNSQTLFETTLKNAIVNKNSATVVDLNSFCDWYLVHELCVNLEPNHPKSCYLYYKNDMKFYAGPVWDFDWGTFVLSKENDPDLRIQKSLFYEGLFKDPAFVQNLKERWSVLKPQFETLGDFIDAQADWIRSSEATNHALWPIEEGHGYSGGAITANGDQTLSFQEAVKRMKDAIDERIDEIDTAIGNLK